MAKKAGDCDDAFILNRLVTVLWAEIARHAKLERIDFKGPAASFCTAEWLRGLE
jgi:hypothetical protein